MDEQRPRLLHPPFHKRLTFVKRALPLPQPAPVGYERHKHGQGDGGEHKGAE